MHHSCLYGVSGVPSGFSVPLLSSSFPLSSMRFFPQLSNEILHETVNEPVDDAVNDGNSMEHMVCLKGNSLKVSSALSEQQPSS